MPVRCSDCSKRFFELLPLHSGVVYIGGYVHSEVPRGLPSAPHSCSHPIVSVLFLQGRAKEILFRDQVSKAPI